MMLLYNLFLLLTIRLKISNGKLNNNNSSILLFDDSSVSENAYFYGDVALTNNLKVLNYSNDGFYTRGFLYDPNPFLDGCRKFINTRPTRCIGPIFSGSD